MPVTAGKVYLVGAGPGDPGLVTLRACHCLATAEVVLYDYLVNPLILAHARPEARLICLGRHGQGRIISTSEATRQMIELAQAGRQVVRLKGGDPVLFAQLADEIAALDAAAVPYEIVPGITAMLAAGSYAGMPLTQADSASAVALITGQERSDKPTPALDFGALAQFPGTLVFYMGVTTAAHWSAALIESGKPADTPCAIVRRASWPDQQTVRCTLAGVAGEIATRRIRPPALVIVGPVAALAPAQNWFVQRPLFGQRVLVTRAAHQAGSLAAALSELGADVLVQPAIEIAPPPDWGPVDRALAQLGQYHWIVFSSANGVRYFLDRLLQSRDLRALGRARLAAIGPASADELARYRLRADVVPDEYRAESLAAALADAAAGQSFLLIRASRGRETLAAELTAAGGAVEQIVVYESLDVALPDPQVAGLLRDGKIDWVTVTSSAIAASLVGLFDTDLGRARLASISPLTSATLRGLGHAVAAEAHSYTTAGLVDAICAARNA